MVEAAATSLDIASERIARICSDRWIAYPRAMQAIDRLHELFEYPKRLRMPNLLIVGPTNNGKSMIAEKFRRDLSAPGAGTPIASQPVLIVQMPASPDVRTVMGALLGAIGLTPFSSQNLAGREHTLVKALRTSGVRMIVIDELHNMLSAHGRQQHQLLNLLRWLGNELQIPLVCIGTREAYLALRTDDQLENRFEPFVLPSWSHGPEFSALLASFEQALQLEQPSDLGATALSAVILLKTDGIIGEVATLLARAAVHAIRTGGGRPYKMTGAKLRLAMAAMGQHETKVADLCRELGITRQTLYRHVSPQGTLRPDGDKLLARGRSHPQRIG